MTTDLRAVRLSTEYAEQPLGVDVASPRFGWVLRAGGRGVTQMAHQVRVATSVDRLAAGAVDVWDSGRVASERSVGVVYAGPRLGPRTRYHWSVRVWDDQGSMSEWSEPAWFETGLFAEAWQAEWIGAAPAADRASDTAGSEPRSAPELDQTVAPAPLLRRRFELAKPVARARLYASGLGYHELRINGRRVGTAVLDPGVTDYDVTVLYVIHDVTDLVQLAENAIGAELGRGFYGLRTPTVWRWEQPPWHGEPRLLAQLIVDHPDGTATVVGTDSSWRVAAGPTVHDSLYAGETYDAWYERPGWDAVGYDDRGWHEATVLDAPAGVLRAQHHEPIRVQADVRPQQLTEPAPGVWVADFGRTMAGWTRLRTESPEGAVVRLVHGERLRDDGSVEAVSNHVHGARFQTDEYIAAGSGDAVWEPRFTYHSFRYVQLEGLPSPPDQTIVTARVVHSEVRQVADFSCSEPLFERYEQAMRRTVLNNLHGIPTDTPMYEKNGWTGDVQVAAPTMATMFDLSRFFAKWLGDLRDSQAPSGQLPVIVPSGGWGYQELAPAPEWTTVYPYLLREMHRWYGDERLLDEHGDAAARYVDWELGRVQDGLAVTALGDYLPPGYPGGIPPEDTRLTASAYLYRALLCMADVSELTGRDPGRWRSAATELADAINAAFLDRGAGHYRTAADPEYRQTSNAAPLAFGIVPDDMVDAVVDSLATDVTARGAHLNTGCLGTSVLLPVLTRHGHADIAAEVALQTTYPSWGFWFENGADTMWEYWGLDARSRDHYFLGTVVQWLYENVAGLRPIANGWQRFVVRPDARSQVEWARLSVETVRGRVASSWRLSGASFVLEVEVPVGSTAEVHLPDPRSDDGYRVRVVGSGRWSFP